jgi:hypothetical protein
MKKISLLLFLSVLISCGDTDETIGISGKGSLTAKVDGVAFTALSVAVGATITNNILIIQGSNANGAGITMTIMNYNGVGTYKIGDNILNNSGMIYGTINPIVSWVTTFNIGTGTLTVTEDNSTTVKGTFSFVGENNEPTLTRKTITEGAFTAPK